MEYIPIPLEVQENVVHRIFVRKQHESIKNKRDDSSDEDEDDVDRSVFVTNMPLDVTDDNVRDICRALGGVVLEKYVRQGRRHGLISLVDASSATRFLKKAAKLPKGTFIKWDQYGPRGAEGYMARHFANFPAESDLQDKVDDFMELFAEQEERDLEEANQAAERVDADGFRLVVNRGRKRLADIPDVETIAKPKKRSLEKKDFYRFQLRERQKTEMSDLLKQYQADKEKVEQLKQQRRFRPY